MSRSEEQELIGLRMVKDKLLTEAQLNTAMDYQKAVGGNLTDVVRRLNLVDAATLDQYIASVDLPTVHVTEDPEAPDKSSDPESPDSDGSRRRMLRRREQLAALARAAETGRPQSVSVPDDQQPTRSRTREFSETAIVVDALIRLLVRKGVIARPELKEEILQMDTEDLVRSGLLR